MKSGHSTTARTRNVTPEIAAKVPGAGAMWFWVAMDADTKLVPCVQRGARGRHDAPMSSWHDLASRLSHRVQLTRDGNRPTWKRLKERSVARSTTRCCRNSTATIQTRSHGAPLQPSQCIGTFTMVVKGRPDPKHISTSYVERLNWSTRTSNAALHAVVEWLQPEDGEPRSRCSAELLRIQLHPDSPDAQSHASNGREGHGSSIRCIRHRGTA